MVAVRHCLTRQAYDFKFQMSAICKDMQCRGKSVRGPMQQLHQMTVVGVGATRLPARCNGCLHAMKGILP